MSALARGHGADAGDGDLLFGGLSLGRGLCLGAGLGGSLGAGRHLDRAGDLGDRALDARGRHGGARLHDGHVLLGLDGAGGGGLGGLLGVAAVVAVVAQTVVLAAVEDGADDVGVRLLELREGRDHVVAADEVLAHHEHRCVGDRSQHGGVDEGAERRGVHDDVAELAAQALEQAAEALGRHDVGGVGDVGLGVQEPEVLRARGGHGLCDVRLAGEHVVDAVEAVPAQARREGAPAHVALHDQDALAAGGEGLGELDGDEGLALPRDGGGHHDAGDRVVHGREADVGRERLGGVLYGDAVDAPLLAGHALSPSPHGRNAADDGDAEELLDLLLAADLGVEHVLDHDDGHGEEEAGHQGHGHVERAVGAAGGLGRGGLVDGVDRLDAHDLLGDAGDVGDEVVGHVGGGLGVGAGDREADDARGGLARDGDVVGAEVLEGEVLRGLREGAVAREQRRDVVGDHLRRGEVGGEAVAGGGVLVEREHVHARGRRVGVAHEEVAVDPHHQRARHGEEDHQPKVLPQQMEKLEQGHVFSFLLIRPHGNERPTLKSPF